MLLLTDVKEVHLLNDILIECMTTPTTVPVGLQELIVSKIESRGLKIDVVMNLTEEKIEFSQYFSSRDRFFRQSYEAVMKERGFYLIVKDHFKILDQLRMTLGYPLTYSSPEGWSRTHRMQEGISNTTALYSTHELGVASDITVVNNEDMDKFSETLKDERAEIKLRDECDAFVRLGFYPSRNFIHIDSAPNAAAQNYLKDLILLDQLNYLHHFRYTSRQDVNWRREVDWRN